MKSPFEFDTRSLAAARIMAGLVILSDLLVRARFLLAHYTSKGALPAAVAFEEGRDSGFPSIYLANDTPLFAVVLFFVHGLVALSLTVGYRTRLSTFLCWYLTASLQYRNPLINTGGDVLLRFILLWCIFAPWGSRWSVDRLLRRHPTDRLTVRCPGTMVLGLQMVLLYLCSTANKWHPTWVKDGTALYYALSVDHITTPYAEFLYRRPELMKLLTFSVIGFECLGGLLLLVPWPRLRLGVVLSFFFMHFCFGLFIEIGIFRYAPMVGLLAFLPSLFWDNLPRGRWVPRAWKAALYRGFRRLPRPPKVEVEWGGRVSAWFLATAFTYGVLTSVQGLLEKPLLPAAVDRVGTALGINQHWPMFIYLDKVKDGWFVIDAELADGTRLDLIHGGEVDFEKPTRVAATYDGQRWRRFMTNIIMPGGFGVLPHYSKYLRQEWDKKYPERPIVKLVLYFMNDPQNPNYRYTPAEKKTLDIWEKAE